MNKGKKKVFTRNGLDWTKRFSVIADALDLSGQAIIDGEVVVIKDGRTNFSELQAELAAGQQDKLVFYAFDMLYLNGFDLRGARGQSSARPFLTSHSTRSTWATVQTATARLYWSRSTSTHSTRRRPMKASRSFAAFCPQR